MLEMTTKFVTYYSYFWSNWSVTGSAVYSLQWYFILYNCIDSYIAPEGGCCANLFPLNFVLHNGFYYGALNVGKNWNLPYMLQCWSRIFYKQITTRWIWGTGVNNLKNKFGPETLARKVHLYTNKFYT